MGLRISEAFGILLTDIVDIGVVTTAAYKETTKTGLEGLRWFRFLRARTLTTRD